MSKPQLLLTNKQPLNSISTEIKSHAANVENQKKQNGIEFYLNNIIMENSQENDDNIFNEILNSITIKDICALFGLNAFNKDVQNNLKIMIPKIIQLYNKYVIATDPEGLLYFLTPLTFYVMSNYYIYKNIATDTNIPNIDHYKIVEPIMNTMRKKFLEKTGQQFAQITGGGKMKGGVNIFTRCLTAAAALVSMTYQGGSYLASSIADIGVGTAVATLTGVGTTAYIASIPRSTNALAGRQSQPQRLTHIVEGAITSGFAQGWGAEMLKPANAGNVAGAAAKYTVASLSDPAKKHEIIEFKTAEIMQGYLGERFYHQQLSESVGEEALEKIRHDATEGMQKAVNVIAEGVTTGAQLIKNYTKPVVNAAAQTGRELAQTASQYAQTGRELAQTGMEVASSFGNAVYTFVTAPTSIELTYNTNKQKSYYIITIDDNNNTSTDLTPVTSMPNRIDVGNYQSTIITDTNLNEIKNSNHLFSNATTYDFSSKIPIGIRYSTNYIEIIYRIDSNVQNAQKILIIDQYNKPIIPEKLVEVSPSVLATHVLPAESTSPVATPATSASPVATPAASTSPVATPAASASPVATPAASASPSAAAKINAEVFVKTHVDPNLYKTMQYIEWLKNNELIDLSEKSADRERLKDNIFTKDGKLNPNAVKDIKARLIKENKSDTGTTTFGSKKTTHNNATKKIAFLESFNPEDTNALIPLSPSGNMYTLLLHTLPNNKNTKDAVIDKLLTKETLSTNSLLTSINATSEKLKELFPVSNPTEAFIQLFNPSYHMYKTSEIIKTENKALQEKASKTQEQSAYSKLSPANQIIQPLTTKSSTNSKTLISYYTNIINWAAPAQVFLNEYFSPIRLFDLKNSNSLTIIKYLIYIFSFGVSASITKLKRKKISESVATAVIISSMLSTTLETVINLAEEQHAYDIKIAQALLAKGFEEGSKMGTFFAKNNIEWTKWGINAGFNLVSSIAAKILMPIAIPFLKLPESLGIALQRKLGQIEGKSCEQHKNEIFEYIKNNPQPSENQKKLISDDYNAIKDKSCYNLTDKGLIIAYYSTNTNKTPATQASATQAPVVAPAPQALGGAACLSGGKRRHKKTKKAPKYKKRKMTRRR